MVIEPSVITILFYCNEEKNTALNYEFCKRFYISLEPDEIQHDIWMICREMDFHMGEEHQLSKMIFVFQENVNKCEFELKSYNGHCYRITLDYLYSVDIYQHPTAAACECPFQTALS